MEIDIKNPDVQRSIDEIVYLIRTEKVIPIVGYDLLNSAFEKKPEDDFLKRLIKIHTMDDDLENRLSNTLVQKFNGYDLLNEYYHNLSDKDTFKLRLSETIQKQRLNRQLIPESYRKLVSIKHFKLIINGTFTNTPELAMNAYRAYGKDEQEIKSSYKIVNYNPSEPEDLPEPASQRNFRINFSKPVIYNLFGTHDEKFGDYVLTDADYVELIYDLIQNKQEKFINLLSYLNAGHLLFLGCNFPDWFFRFFIRVCVGDRLDNASPAKKKAVIDSLNRIDFSRLIFIHQYKIQALEIDCNDLINEIYEKLKNEQGEPSILGDNENNLVFISYCRADEKVAKDIACQLKRAYIDFFWDNVDLRKGDYLNNRITNAIDKACLFLPIVSNNLRNSSNYVWEEWQYALSANKKIWPIFKESVNPDMLIPDKYNISEDLKSKIRTQILNMNTTIGFVPQGDDNLIQKSELNEIKKKQYLSRVSGNKTILQD